MPTRKQTIVARITELERANEANQNEMDALKRELSETPDALLDRDPQADATAGIQAKNEFLRDMGLIP